MNERRYVAALGIPSESLGRRPVRRAARIVLTVRSLLIGVFVPLLLLTGCGAASEEVTVIDFWGLGVEGEIVKQLVPDFEREHPDIRVRVQQIPWTAAHEKLLTAYVGDATPDLCQLGNTWVPEFAALNALASLDSLARSSDVVDRSDYFEGIWETNVVEETTYGIPWYVDTRLLFYRSDILEQAGYDAMPGTWAEWLEAMQRIKEIGGDNRWAILLPTDEWQHPVMFGLQTGASLLTEDGLYADFSSPEFRKAFEFYVSLYESGVAPAVGRTQVSNVYQEFARGYMSMYITGPWNIGEFGRHVPADAQDDWMTAAMPGPGGDSTGVSLAGGASLVIFERSDRKEAAWKFIEFMSRPEQQIRFYDITGNLPPRYTAWEDSALAQNIYADAFYEQLQRVEPLPRVPEWERIADKVWVYAEAAVLGRMTIDAALAELDREVDEILEKRRWMAGRTDGALRKGT